MQIKIVIIKTPKGKFEVREYKYYEGSHEHGKSNITIRCPYCDELVTAYIWSLHGSGKNCTKCKAHFTASNMAYRKIKEAKK